MSYEQVPVRWDPVAKERLDELYRYLLKEESERVAMHVWRTLVNLAGELGKFPRKFPLESYLEDEPEEYRAVPKWNYKLIYEVAEDAVIIVDLFHTARDPRRIQNR